ncbi:MAG: gamma carbonic anhydrase family protein [Planctomycetota bacterium]
MLVENDGKRPRIAPSAYVAPNAVVSGDVTIGENSRVLFGAVVTADGGPVTIGDNTVVMENAVVRGTPRHPMQIGDSVMIGPGAYLTGCEIADCVFIATGVTVFNGARIGLGAEVRINGVVHLKTLLPAGATVPIGWVAVGDPAWILAPDKHEEIWKIQEALDFPKEVFGVERSPDVGATQRAIMARYTRALGRHHEDVIIE